MLVLTRREGESIEIGPPDHPVAILKITEIKGDRVRVGFFSKLPVHRREVADLIRAGVPECDAIRRVKDARPKV